MNAATKSTRPPSPQDREDLADFLLRTAGFAALLSFLLMFGPPVLLSLWPPNLGKIAGAVELLILFFPHLVIVILIALLVSAAVTLCLGAVLAAACRARGIGTIGTRTKAMRFGAIAGAVIALVEAIVILLYWTSYTGPSRELGAGMAFFLQNPPPSLGHALKVMFDMAATIGIGAISGWLAWRPLKPSPSPATPSPPAV